MTIINDPYQDIRPYSDDEVPSAIERLLSDDEFIQAIIHYRCPKIPKLLLKVLSPLLRHKLKKNLSTFQTVKDVQQHVAKYLSTVLDKTTDSITFSGLDKLDPKSAYLFVSNHRDIAMDPAIVNWVLNENHYNTLRIAIGDNLLKKPGVSELMRLNKSFIVKRSAKAPREMMKALSQLSAYISHSLETNNSIWIAQKEGRAKDGNDQTDPAILKMFHVEGRKRKIAFPEFTKSLNIVPVSISYESDPCDLAKARELNEIASTGSYQKSEFEDIDSIILGITGYKGRVHINFGDVINQAYETPVELASEIDRQIHSNYKLFPNNYLAAEIENTEINDEVKRRFNEKLVPLSPGEQDVLKKMYANPVHNQQQQ